MRNKIKHSVAFLILAIFLANITGGLFSCHLAIEGDCEHHDSEDCEICQNLFINSAKIINMFSAATFLFEAAEDKIEYIYDVALTFPTTPNLIPRAPPA